MKKIFFIMGKISTLISVNILALIAFLLASIGSLLDAPSKLMNSIQSLGLALLVVGITGLISLVHKNSLVQLASMSASEKQHRDDQKAHAATDDAIANSRDQSTRSLGIINRSVNELRKELSETSKEINLGLSDSIQGQSAMKVLISDIQGITQKSIGVTNRTIINLGTQIESSEKDSLRQIQDLITRSEFKKLMMIQEFYNSLNMQETINVPTDITGEINS